MKKKSLILLLPLMVPMNSEILGSGNKNGKGCCSGGCCGGGCCAPAKPASKPQKPVHAAKQSDKDQKEIIQHAYAAVAASGSMCALGGGCCGGGAALSEEIGYTKEELNAFADANLGLGCGHSVSIGQIQEGNWVLDLGSGAGLDCFLASRKAGPSGKVIGVDMTPAMIQKARKNAIKYNITNVEFRQGDIEELPVEDGCIDIVMSNCVINLAPNKDKVFAEAYRVLKPGGKMAVSDVVLLDELTPEQKANEQLLCACVSGAILKSDYIALLEKTGFDVEIIDEDTKIGETWFGDTSLPISSLKFVAYKK